MGLKTLVKKQFFNLRDVLESKKKEMRFNSEGICQTLIVWKMAIVRWIFVKESGVELHGQYSSKICAGGGGVESPL